MVNLVENKGHALQMYDNSKVSPIFHAFNLPTSFIRNYLSLAVEFLLLVVSFLTSDCR